MIHVDLHCDTLGTHLLQVFSGLYLLQQQGSISLSIKAGLPLTLARPNRQFLAMRVRPHKNSREFATFLFDLQDSPVPGLAEAISQVDFYVKRSLEPSTLAGLDAQQARKIIPFGLNYQILSFPWLFFLRLAFSEFLSRPYNPLGKKHRFHVQNLKDIFDALLLKKKNNLLSHIELDSAPSAADNGSVMFQCRLWEPAGIAEKNRDDANLVNQSRIQLIRSLKAELGEKFWGGLQNTAYAREVAPDLIATLPSARREYLAQVRQASIVVSSTGLLQSNGWKLGEYVALGKCVVSEPIYTQLPGDFSAGKNYLPYESAEQCISVVGALRGDKNAVMQVEAANNLYTRAYLAPDKLMANILQLIDRTGGN